MAVPLQAISSSSKLIVRKPMTEQALKDYFTDKINANALSKDLIDSATHGKDTSYYKIAAINCDEKFTVTKKHLIKLCRDIINHNIKIEDLEVITFALETSDYFTWDTSTKDGNEVDDTITNWSNRENNNPITMTYVEYCAYYLEFGEHR
ncbi:MAG: hypothetical protein SFU87_03140 [Chitinophagaceae bacterium]|nr:hypothetical protein [Chitinophagaceae bacterium]